MSSTQPDSAPGPDATPTGIVVGVDGSPQAAHGYQWAVRQTDRLGPVTLVTAWHSPWWYKVGAPMIAPDGPDPDIERAARGVLDDLMTHNPLHPAVEQLVVKGSAGHVLADASEQANALVLGADEGGSAAHRLVGSVRTYCAAHCSAPLIVVPERHPLDDRTGLIVVGIDGSPGADAALDWALGYADPEQRIVAVNAWNVPVVTGYEQIAIDPAVVETATVERAAESVGAACARAGVAAGRVEAKVTEGDPRQVLESLGSEADLTVVGRRGHGRVMGILLGSVATALTRHPAGPIAIIPPPT